MDIICAIIALMLIVIGTLSKIMDAGSSIIIVLLLVITRLVIGVNCLLVILACLMILLAVKLLLKKVNFTAYELISNQLTLSHSIALFALSFCHLAALVLCIEIFPNASHDFNFVNVAFYATLGSAFSIELASVVNGFAKSGLKISNSEKCSPFVSGAITIYGAISALITSFSFGVLYYFSQKSIIPSIITVLLGFIGYLLYSLAVEKLEYKEKVVTPTVENTPAESEQPTEPTEAEQPAPQVVKSGIEGFNKTVICFICLLVITAVALVIGFILK